jgi:acetolactate synthase-1/2/3 large subunit
MANAKGVDRRGFLKGAAAGAAAGVAAGAATLVSSPLASAANVDAEPLPITPQEAARALATETAPLPPEEEGMVVIDPGSDFMVDVIKTLGFEYIASNPSSSFRGIHESFINYNHNKGPEWITCLHEEVSVNIANGYYAVAGKPMAVMTFAPCGIQHASMAIFGSFTGHTPTYIMCSSILDAVERRPSTDWWEHAVMDPAALARDFLKWDDTPVSLQHFAESSVRAYKMAMTEPRGPVMIVVDGALQEKPNPNRSKLHIPKLTLDSPPVGDPNAVAEAAKLLVAAANPVIVAGDVARDEEGMRLLVELAETLQAPVQGGGRGMPNRHPLSGGGNISTADAILSLNQEGLFNVLNDYRDQAVRYSTPRISADTKVISISAYDLYMRSNYQNVDRYQEVDMAIAGDPQATLPTLIEACKKLITSDRRVAIDARAKKYAAASAQTLERLKVESTYGWDSSPISMQRLSMELYDVIKDKDWASISLGGGNNRLWNFDKFYRQMGTAIGGGVGGDFPMSVGGALAHKKDGRLCVGIQKDGDMMYVNNAMWTAVHHKIPFLLVMQNNRAYHQEVMHLQRMANRRQRGMDMVHLGCPGTFIRDPDIDFAMLAKSMGAYAEGPITDPKELRPAIIRAVAQVEKGEVALLDTITQPR